MSLGTGALKVSGVPAVICWEEVPMATLEAGTTPQKQLLTGTVTQSERIQWKPIITIPHTYQRGIPRGREWRVQESAKVRLKRQQ